MRNKRAKMLRKVVKRVVLADNPKAPKVAYVGGKPPEWMPIMSPENLIMGYKKVAAGIPKKLDKNCIRFSYRLLKNAYRRA